MKYKSLIIALYFFYILKTKYNFFVISTFFSLLAIKNFIIILFLIYNFIC
jgi:hypothetical protein